MILKKKNDQKSYRKIHFCWIQVGYPYILVLIILCHSMYIIYYVIIVPTVVHTRGLTYIPQPGIRITRVV